ncbi:MAG: dihydroneopterin aldolase [Bacteroidales bacterium]|nr:dihydroneopterin aldolase [Bacteroidales bacterium]
MNAITLHKMKFFAHHGVGEQERVVGNHFEVTLKVYCPMDKAMTDDDLCGTVNYAELYAAVEKEMAKPSQLLENVAYRIIKSIKADFPTVTGGEITISKLTPPFKCDMEKVDVTIEF